MIQCWGKGKRKEHKNPSTTIPSGTPIIELLCVLSRIKLHILFCVQDSFALGALSTLGNHPTDHKMGSFLCVT